MIKTNKNNDLLLVKSNFNEKPFWYNLIPDELVDEKFIKSVDSTKYFDQNGYDLTELEKI
jgi:hypothetical protein